jgi:type IV fimbrial biogenesis protein FimT
VSGENPRDGAIVTSRRFEKVRSTSGAAGGFTLIEISIVILIVSIVALLAVPAMTTGVSNSKVRSVAETVQNGLRAAQAEALRRSRQTAFVLTNSAIVAGGSSYSAISGTTASNWFIQVLPLYTSESISNPVVQSGSFGTSTSGVTISTSDGSGVAHPAICFNSMGRLVTNTSAVFGSASCTIPSSASGAATYDLTHPSADRTLEVQVQPSGQVRLCDKSRTLSATSPDGC